MLKLYNSLTAKKEEFTPLDLEKAVRMYVCGPTVYDRAHIGNARAVVVYDVLFRLLKDIYGDDKVIYARNITDVDDKINKAAVENGETIKELTERVTGWFWSDMAELNNLEPTHQPKATENIDKIIGLIEDIIKNGKAYVSEGHVLFDVKAFGELDSEEAPFCCHDLNHDHEEINNSYYYGKLSGKKLDDLIAGARVEVESYKRNPEDFVLWKPAFAEATAGKPADDPSSIFDSPWGIGRPGWHIECSAMSTSILGDNFDIHGGGADLKFPHHENEIAQSLAATPYSKYAKFWVHNGFVTVNGEKMSKSLGNFTTVKDLLDKGIKGEVIRFTLLSAHYRKPLDFNDKLLEDSKKSLDKLYKALKIYEENKLDSKTQKENKDQSVQEAIEKRNEEAFSNLKEALLDDMNAPLAMSHLYTIAKGLRSFDCTEKAKVYFDEACELLGVCQISTDEWFEIEKISTNNKISEEEIEIKIAERLQAKKDKDWAKADQIRDELSDLGITIKDTANGTDWSW